MFWYEKHVFTNTDDTKGIYKIPFRLVPKEFINYNDLYGKVYNNHLYLEIQRRMYRLPQAGKLANILS